MTLQNRVDPQGFIHAINKRGTMMGNRGGRFHDPGTKTLTNRRWANKAWIICVTDFKNRHRTVMGLSYTELFFLDEVTALASGHRPCFECRRQAAKSYQAAWQQAEKLPEPPKVGVMDPLLHQERLEGKHQRRHTIQKAALVDGVVLHYQDHMLVVKDGHLLAWSFDGYQKAPFQTNDLPDQIVCLTPPATVKALRHGYQPIWHESAIE